MPAQAVRQRPEQVALVDLAPGRTALRRAYATATGSISAAYRRAPPSAAATATPAAPDPQHRSRTTGDSPPARLSAAQPAAARRTRNSVRRRGTKTPGPTAIRSPQNSAQPTTCSSGIPSARRSTMALSSAGLAAAATSSCASASAKTQPAARSRATISAGTGSPGVGPAGAGVLMVSQATADRTPAPRRGWPPRWRSTR